MNPELIKILHIDSNHPILWSQLEEAGFSNEADYKSSKEEVEAKILAESAVEVDRNVKEYLELEPQPLTAMFDYLYATLPKAYADQRESLKNVESIVHG